MKPLPLFILIFLVSFHTGVNACGYYPFGEDIRFSLLNSNIFRYKDYSPFYYTSHYFSNPVEETEKNNEFETSLKLNLDLWKKRCKGVPTDEDIYDAIYIRKNEFNNPNSDNKFVQCLFKNKDYTALTYLAFAQNVETMNEYLSDPWERNTELKLPQRERFINTALQNCETVKDDNIKRRYAFIAIRLAYYNQDVKVVKEIYQTYFSNLKRRNIIDYWSMYFMALCESDASLCNYYSAQVFTNAPDKRFQIRQQINRKISINKTLQHAKNNNEKAAIWLFYGITNPGRAMESIQNIYRYNPKSDGVSILLLREINKLEDWIYTPYYSYFESSLIDYEKRNLGYANNQIRIADDRKYAARLLAFCNKINSKRVENPLLLNFSKAYLNLMVLNFTESLLGLNTLQKKYKYDVEKREQIALIKALCITAQQQKDQAVILEEIKPVLIGEIRRNNFKFVFAIGRELEFKGNTTDAAILYSKLNNGNDCEYYDCESFAFWKTKKQHNTLYNDYYTNYFYYLDAQYTTRQLETLIQNIIKPSKNDRFSVWKYSNIRNDISRLYDLLGTKYIRVNDLKNALKAFEKVNDTLWTSIYMPYNYYLAANPFYTNMFNEHKPTEADSIKYNKLSIVKTLVLYRKLAENPANKDRDYYYFLIANCYFNMSHYGNSWMMRRYFSSNRMLITKLIDDDEYFNCKYAKHYYLKAKSTSKKKKFAALCLRMAGRCEDYRLQALYTDSYGNWNYDKMRKKVTQSNKYYHWIKQKYPDSYNDLMSNCESFDSYFNARN